MIRIDRFFDAEQVLTWYEAQVFCDLNAERVGSILYNPSKPQQKHVQASLIAKQNQVVWGMNTVITPIEWDEKPSRVWLFEINRSL